MNKGTDRQNALIRSIILGHVIEHDLIATHMPRELGGEPLWEPVPEKLLLVLFREQTQPGTESRCVDHYYQRHARFTVLAEEQFGNICTVRTMILDGTLCCLFCTEAGSALMLESEDMMDRLRAFRDTLTEQMGITFTLYLSDAVEDPSALNAAYQNARYLIQYDEIMQTGQTILVPTDIRWRQADASQILIADKKYQNCLYLRDYKKAAALAMELMTLETDSAATYCINLKDRVLARADAALDSLNLSYDGETPEIPALIYFEKILHSKTLQDFQTLLPLFYAALDSYLSDAVREYSNQVIDYIQSHYADPGLCAEMICQKFNISYYRLSGIINDYAGVGLNGFINGLRLTEAKRRLEETDEKIDVIAREVGYLTARTLNRVFLRYEGTTPREYRQMHKSPDEPKN